MKTYLLIHNHAYGITPYAFKSRRGDDIRNRVLCALRLMLVWACELKPELNAEMLYNSLQCRPAYIDLVAAAYYVER